MSPYLDDGDVQLYVGDARAVLAELPERSVHAVLTSPPFFGLRDYQTGTWEGGDPACSHEKPTTTMNAGFNERWGQGGGEKRQERKSGGQYAGECPKCGAVRVDHQIGLEATPDEWAASLVEVFAACRRVLRDDGSLWVECGDSYATTSTYSVAQSRALTRSTERGTQDAQERRPTAPIPDGVKAKDLIGAPWLLARALRDPHYGGEIREERDRVWLAATIDAEGSISGHRHVRKDDGRVRTGCHITITNTSEALLEEAHRVWPASRVQHERRENAIGSRPCWRWVATNVDRNALLMREMYPYLIVKRQQALLAYNLFELSRISKRIGKTQEGERARGQRDWLVAALSRLNHGEDVDVPSWCVTPPTLWEPGWYLRGAYIWEKPDCMPESVRDRCTTSHSFVFHFAKSSRYFFDRDAIREPFSDYSTGGDGGSYGANADAARPRPDGGPRGSGVYRRNRGGVPDGQVTLDGQEPEQEIVGPDGRKKLEHKTGDNGHENYENRDGAQRWPSLEGRSPRSVWRITTEANSFGLCPACRRFWPEKAPARHCGVDVVAHFAVWPHKLVERIIACSTSEAGTCGDCGATRIRVTESEQERDHETTAPHGLDRRDIQLNGIRDGIRVATTHLGWESTCECAAPTVPATVLDPFGGSGTTARQARAMGRHCVLVELSPDYAEIASHRLSQLALPLAVDA